MPPRIPSPLSVRALRVIRGIAAESQVSQNQLAARSGLTQPQVSRLFSGRATLKVDELEALCDGLGVPVVDVIRAASAP